MFNSFWPESDPPDRPLPEPTVDFRTNETPSEAFTEAQVGGILTNPVYAGVGPFPSLISDAQWVHACKRLIDEDGAEQFLVNLLFVLRKSFDFDGPAPYGLQHVEE